MFGVEETELEKVFMHDLPPMMGESPLRVIVCQCGAGGIAHAVSPQKVNHFMIAILASCSHCGATCFGSCRHLDKEPPTGFHGRAAFDKWYMDRGYFIVDTRTDGNCGLDCMAYFSCDMFDEARNLATCLEWRKRLAQFMRDHAQEDMWHDIFVSCEGLAVDAVVMASATCSSSSGSDSSSESSDRSGSNASNSDSQSSDSSGSNACSSSDSESSQAASHESADHRCSKTTVPSSLEHLLTNVPRGALSSLSDDMSLSELANIDSGHSELLPLPPPEAPPAEVDNDCEVWMHGSALAISSGNQRQIDDLPLDKRILMFQGYHAYMDTLATFDRPPRKQGKQGPKQNVRFHKPLAYRRMVGESALRFLRERFGSDATSGPNWAALFCRKAWAYPEKKSVPKAMTSFVRRCVALVKRARPITGARRVGSDMRARKPDADRKRVRGLQGRPAKCIPLREALFEWFVDVRRLVKGRISYRVVQLVALDMASHVIRKSAALGFKGVDMPLITKPWVRRFCRSYGISLRSPNRRYKVSFPKLLSRLRTMWLNLFRVRLLCWLFFGVAEMPIEGADQKGLHFNEAGSKLRPTLELCGTPEVILKENHSQTRQRLSLTTMTTSCAHDIRNHAPPLEILFKGKTAKTIESLKRPEHVTFPLSFAFAEKGSYRVEHVLAFLQRHLKPWTPERAAAHDWRILQLDAFRPHVDPAVFDMCRDHGYVLVLHGGGTTGVCQVNDTDIHGPFSAEYVVREELSLHVQSLVQGSSWTPTRSPQDIVETSCEAWAGLDHELGIKGHKLCGLSIALDGSEDDLVSREARRFWDEAPGMPSLRREALAEVTEAFYEGKWPDFESAFQDPAVVAPFDDDAIFEEGFELDNRDVAHDDAAGKPWVEEVEQEAAMAETSLESFEAWSSAPLAIQKAATDYVNARARLEAMQAEAAKANSAHLQLHCRLELERLDKAHRCDKSGSNVVIRNWLSKKREDQASQIQTLRLANEESRREKRREQKVRLRHRTRHHLVKEERKRQQAQLEKEALKGPLRFSLEDFGQGHKHGGDAKHNRNRMAALDRLRLRPPPLPAHLEAQWQLLRESISKHYAATHKHAVGFVFKNAIDTVVAALGVHALPVPGVPVAPKGASDDKAFQLWVSEHLESMAPALMM